jgi:Tol biopolymer transport system component
MTYRARLTATVGLATLAVLAAAIVAAVLPAGATPPGANGKLVFERPTPAGGDGFAVDMLTVEADGTGLTKLTDRKFGEGDSSWSQDGRKVAFTCTKNTERGPWEICVVNADGSGFAQLTRHRSFSIAPAWSPDGRIVYASAAGAEHLRLRVMNADGSGNRLLTRNRRLAFTDPQWSPDGTTIALATLSAGETTRSFDCSIVLIDADGGNLRRLTRRGGPDEMNPNWSPDGTTIAFERNRLHPDRQADIWLMQADGSRKRGLTSTRFHETNPTFSPDGTRIAFTGDRHNRKLSKERLGRGFELYTMAADGSDVRRLTRNRRADLFADWQPLP